MAQTRSKEVSTKAYRPSFLDTTGDIRPSVERELTSISNAIKSESDKFKNFRPYMDKEGYYIYPTGSGGGYLLPTASASVKGGVKIGAGLAMNGETLSATGGGSYVLPAATASVRGGIKVGSGLTITSDVLSVTPYTLPVATATVLGGVKQGANITIAADGTISASGGGGTPVDAYTKTESDAKYETKTDATASLALKADKATTYTKTEVDTIVSNTAPDLSKYLRIDAAAPAQEVESIVDFNDSVRIQKSLTARKTGTDEVDIDFAVARVVRVPETPLYANSAASKSYVDAHAGGGSGDVTQAGNNNFTGVNTFTGNVIVPDSDADVNPTHAVNGKSMNDFIGKYIGYNYEVNASSTVDCDVPPSGSGGGLGEFFINKPAIVPTMNTDVCIFTLQSFGVEFTYKFENLTTGLVAVRTLKNMTGAPLSPWVLAGDGQGSGSGGVTVPDTLTDMDTNTTVGWFRTSLTTGTGVTASLKAIVTDANQGDEAIVNHIQHSDFAYQTAYIGGPHATNAKVGTYYYFRVKPDSNPWVDWQKVTSGGSGTGTTEQIDLSYIGETKWHHSGVQIPDYAVRQDGQLLKRSEYPDLWALIDSGDIATIDDAAWLSGITSRGAYTKGTIDTGADANFRIPDLNGVQTGSIGGLFVRGSQSPADAGVLGTIRQNAAPNITGDVTTGYSTSVLILEGQSGAFTATGAAVNKLLNPSTLAQDTLGTARNRVTHIDASRSNAAYGRNTTTEVRPNSVSGIWILIAKKPQLDVVVIDTFIGAVNWFNGDRTKIPESNIPSDGQVINRVDEPELWALVEDGTFPAITDTQWLASTGERGKYSLGDGTTTFRVPDLNGKTTGAIQGMFLRGEQTGMVTGETRSSALPNLKGALTPLIFNAGTAAGGSGVFQKINGVTNLQSASGAGNFGQASLTFDASVANAIYKDGVNEVRPPSVSGIWVIKSKSASLSVQLPSSKPTLNRWYDYTETTFTDYIDITGNATNPTDVLMCRFADNCLYIRGILRKNIPVDTNNPVDTSKRILYKLKKVPPGYTKAQKPYGLLTTNAVFGTTVEPFSLQIVPNTVVSSPIDVIKSGGLGSTYQMVDECIVFS